MMSTRLRLHHPFSVPNCTNNINYYPPTALPGDNYCIRRPEKMTIRYTLTKQDNWSQMLFGSVTPKDKTRQGSARELASAPIGQNYARIARAMLLRKRSRQNAAALGCSGRHHRNDARECNSQGSGSGHRAAGIRVDEVHVIFALHRRLAAQLLELGLCE